MTNDPVQVGDAASNRGEYRRRLAEVAGVFTLLGFTAFGGPAAHISLMREQCVRRRGWLDDQRFADLIGIVNLIPGPSSTELGMYLGFLRAGWLGLIVSGVCFIGPAMLIVLALAWGYVTFGALPEVGAMVRGIAPVVIAIIAQALWGLGRTVLRGIIPILASVVVLGLFLLGANTVALILGGGIFAGLFLFFITEHGRRAAATLSLSALLAGSAATPGMLALFLTFLKIGAVTFGSGYVLLAFLHGDLVTQQHVITDRQLLDAVSVGQFTPGPVFTTATFIGYLVGGVPGALIATLGIFLPAFLFVPLIHPLASRIRQRRVTATLLDGVNAAALGLMGGVLVELGRNAFTGVLPVVEAIVALAILLRFKINSIWLIVAAMLMGLGTTLIR
jgi:chromate transporter